MQLILGKMYWGDMSSLYIICPLIHTIKPVKISNDQNIK